MPYTKVTKRKDVERDSLPHPDSSDDELPPNVGNGNLVEDELVHVHEKCDHLMAQLKALNQAVGDPVSVISTSPFITLKLVTPITTPVADLEIGKEIAVATDTASDDLVTYLTQSIVVDTNPSLDLGAEGQLCGETVKIPPAIEVNNVIIDEAGVQQPLRSIGEMLDELPKASSISNEISESNIVVDTPVYNRCLVDMTHEKKQPKVKAKGLAALKAVEEAKKKGIGHGDGGAAPPAPAAPSGRGRGVHQLPQGLKKVSPGKVRATIRTTPFLHWPQPQGSLQGLPKESCILMVVIPIWKVLGRPLVSSFLLYHSRRSQRARVSWHLQGPSRNHTGIAQALWHFNKFRSIKRALSCYAGNCVWPDWLGKLHRDFEWTFISRQKHC